MAEKLSTGKETAKKILEFAPESEKPFIHEVGQRLDELTGRYQEYQETAESAFAVLERNVPDKKAAEDRLDRMQQMETAIAGNIRLLHGALEARIVERVTRTQERERRTGVVILGLSVVAIAVGLLATLVAARALRPVRTLIDGASRVGRGDYSAQIGLKGEDEISLLGREFDHMARSLKEREAQLAEKQAELLRAERLAAVGRMASQVAHEVRNPLSSIGLNVELLDDPLARAKFASEADEKEVKELLTRVTKEVDRLTELTEHYLRLARLPSPNRQPEDVHALIGDVLSFQAEELGKSGVKVERALSGNGVKAQIDAGQIRQVLLNLVRNAREAMPRGGTLTVRTVADAEKVRVEISDTGAGVPIAERERVFEPFFSTKSQGTGLGLSLSRQIVDAHGGALTVEGPEGQGATFAITLPAA
jgi:signal transduction histidine kinase